MSVVDTATVIGAVAGAIAAIAAALALVPPLRHWLKEKWGQPHRVQIDYKNALVARIRCAANTYPDSKLGFVFYNLRIVNISDKPLTISSVRLAGKMDEKSYEEDSYAVATGMLESGEQGLVLCVQNERGPKANIVMVGWKNARSVLASHPSIESGGVLAMSAVYVLGDNTPGLALEDLELVVEDYRGKQSRHSLPGGWRDARENTELNNVPFRQSKGHFIWGASK
jgi:hypothetical protein